MQVVLAGYCLCLIFCFHTMPMLSLSFHQTHSYPVVEYTRDYTNIVVVDLKGPFYSHLINHPQNLCLSFFFLLLFCSILYADDGILATKSSSMKGSNHRLVVSVFLLLFSASLLSYYAAVAVDILATNQSLPDGQTIISSNGTFEMGFFNLENSRYFGIWFKKVTKFTLVWIANRDSPLLFNDTSGFLHMSPQGLLILQNATTNNNNNNNNNNNLIWSSNSSSSSSSSSLSNNPIAQLLDSGNLVIRDSNDLASSNPIWQSFDHPGNTMLPGLKLGLNLVSGIDRFLQSWKNPNDPSRGQYIFRMDPNGFPQEYLLNGTTKIFRSGPWNGLRFSGSPGLKPNQVYTYEFVNTPEEIYYKFDLIQPSVYSILLLNSNGVLQRLTWNNRTEDWTVYLNAPADNCDYYGLCSAYGFCSISNSPVCNCLDKFVPKYPTDWLATDWSRGCVRRTPLDCKNGDGFVKYEGIKLPDTRNSWYDNGMSLKECERICLNNCSCMAYTNTDIRGKGSGCLLWFDDLMDITKFTSNGQDIYIRMASSELGSKAGKGKVIGISIGVVFGVLLLGMFLTLYIWKMKKKNKRQTEELITQGKSGSYSDKQQQQLHQTNEDEIMEDLDLELPLIDFSKIVEATNNFSKANKLGEGGFGPVYEGKFMDGQEIAVKRLSEYSIQGLDEFKNEVKCIAKLQHRNLVKLLGYCLHGEEKMLIYEFMPNKSLDYFIFDNDRRRLVDWTMRYEIITGIARGLLYLHQDSRFRIIHRDLKASNILLDHDMKPKISDFGMARIFGGTETAANTRRVVGTYGYMSPEYAVDGFFSTKSDIFSYGVLVLEIVSGKKNRGFFHSDHHHNLLGHAWLLFKDGRFHELIDEELSKSCHFSQVIRSINVALLCVQQNPDDRPSMSSVILMLASEGPLPIPKEPGFFTERNLFFEPSARDKSSSSKQADSSGNDFSITLLDAR